jgi:exo-beta-1,3-glucanase (GH17 family)
MDELPGRRNTAMRFPGTRSLVCLLAVGAVQVGISSRIAAPIRPPDVPFLASVSFSPNQRGADPERGDMPRVPEIARDLAAAHKLSGRVRTYTVSQNMDYVPLLADGQGVKVTLGSWVDRHDPARTEREFREAAMLAREHASVDRVVVGNESLLRGDATPAELVSLMARMRAATGKPISTGETWDIWLKHPELARAADFLTIHVLPYWEGVPASDAVRVAMEHYDAVRTAYPGKPVVIGEFGWPSGKFNRGAAVASLANEAAVVRGFAAEASRRGIDYNVIEAFDQPWKTVEGDVGANWGLLDADRTPKFPLAGPVAPDPGWLARSITAAFLGLALSWLSLAGRRVTAAQAAAMSVVGEIAGVALADAAWVPFEGYSNLGLVAAWAAGLPLVGLLALTAFDRVRELVDASLGRPPARLLRPATSRPGYEPFVSVHVPACREVPSVVIRTLESLAAMDWRRYEVLVVVNNTTEPHLVEPVRDACSRLGARFRFVHLPNISGFKAGALNAALRMTSSEAEIVAVVDADYVVSPDWFRDLAPSFSEPRLALVQAPQEHRDEGDSWLKLAMNAEYAGFFDSGMVWRNEDDAIIAHGTMLMVRREALETVGGWGEGFICEDTELGLRLVEAGWATAYTDRRYGAGLLPDTLRAFRKQRDRWAYGAMRIMLAHLRQMTPWARALTAAQKWHFMTGWMHWVGDAAAVCLAAANVAWVAWMQATGLGEPPPEVLTVATGVAAMVALVHTLAVHALRVRRGGKATLLAALAGLSLQMTVARAVLRGLVLDGLPFAVTAKGGRATCGTAEFASAFGPELVLGGALLTAAWATVASNHWRIVELDLFAAVMAVQALPFLAAFSLGAAEFVGLSCGQPRAPAPLAAPTLPAFAGAVFLEAGD